jgi:predicted transcriptional regulator with HTH domain
MKLSEKKKEKISEQLLAYLYSINPKPIFTSHLADEIVRDDEMVKNILQDLAKKELVIEIKKNPKGKMYSKRSRWVLSDRAYQIYKDKQQ